MMPSLAPFQHPETSIYSPGIRLYMETTSPGGKVDYWISLQIPGTSGGMEFSDNFRYRLFGFYCLSQMPEAGLQEAAESLKAMWEYYRVPFVSVPSLPSPPALAIELGEPRVRPTFQVSEED